MIVVENVHYTYPNGVEALKGVSLRIKDGEFVAIMGENGAGKTTLVLHLNGLLKPTKGRVLVDGVDTREVSVAQLSRKVGLVFQNPDSQFFCSTVEEEIAFALKNFGFSQEVIEKRITWALNLMNLKQYRHRSPFTLSGGEKKRVALAAVLAWDPQILILDEPTIGQDYRQKEKLRQFILQLNSQGRTVIIVTHDVEFVADCIPAPRVVLMAGGKVIADGDAEEVLTNPELVEKASLIQPQISQVFQELADLGLPRNVLNVYEARRIILERWRGR